MGLVQVRQVARPSGDIIGFGFHEREAVRFRGSPTGRCRVGDAAVGRHGCLSGGPGVAGTRGWETGTFRLKCTPAMRMEKQSAAATTATAPL